MFMLILPIVYLLVALLAEGVDRNIKASDLGDAVVQSPSSRRAWIEITQRPRSSAPELVALLAEGADRNQNHFASQPANGKRWQITK